MSKTVIFFGNERLATGVNTTVPTLSGLIKNGYEVAAVVANYEKAQSRKARDLEIAQAAEQYQIPLLLPEKLMAIYHQLEQYKADIGVLVAYGKIVPKQVIDIFPHGIINIHPSLLPLHRGPTPIESVILQGNIETGVSLMRLAPSMDAGPVYVQDTFKLKGNETKQYLSNQLLELGKNMLIEHLPAILRDELLPKPQNEDHATYDRLISKQDGVVDWNKPATVLEREIRAYLNWPKSRTILAGKEVIITQGDVITEQGKPGEIKKLNGSLVICCGKDSIQIQKLKPAGKNEMTGEAFLAGHYQLIS